MPPLATASAALLLANRSAEDPFVGDLAASAAWSLVVVGACRTAISLNEIGDKSYLPNVPVVHRKPKAKQSKGKQSKAKQQYVGGWWKNGMELNGIEGKARQRSK